MMNYLFALTTLLHGKRDDERGATAVEYGLLVVLIAAVIVGTVLTLGTEINQGFTDVVNRLQGTPAAT